MRAPMLALLYVGALNACFISASFFCFLMRSPCPVQQWAATWGWGPHLFQRWATCVEGKCARHVPGKKEEKKRQLRLSSEWVAVPRPDTHQTLISLGAVDSWSVGWGSLAWEWEVSGLLFCCLLLSLVAERRWGLSFVLAPTLPLPNLCLQCYQRR